MLVLVKHIIIVELFARVRRFTRVLSILILLLFSVVGYSEIIEVGGVLEENQTWKEENTYIVKSDLYILNNITLIIEPGVLVKFDYGTGLTVDSGNIISLGTKMDSVSFIPNYSRSGKSWKWKGLIIKNVDSTNEISFSFSRFINAETAIRIENSESISIEFSSIYNCQYFGLQMYNTNESVVNNCNIESNYNGIEVVAGYLSNSSNNTLTNNIIKNQNHNIYVALEKTGEFRNNLIQGNIIGSGNNGIWLGGNEESATSNNLIEQNVILYNGNEVGYGLFLGQDSSTVINNIFWRNKVAVFTNQNGNSSFVNNNSFYQNNWAIAFTSGSEDNMYFNNTFSINKSVLLVIQETKNLLFGNNNLMHTQGLENIIVNNTNLDYSIINNYWGTTDTTDINILIYDKFDDPSLGEVIYKPYLADIDISNPISPPYKIIKQLVGNRVKISWQSNKESDLMGYNVYSGNFFNYSFSNFHTTGTDSSFYLTNTSIFDSIAITAFDSLGLVYNAQKIGHESPFAFAQIYPYAGPDTLLCKDVEEYKLVDSNIPFAYDNFLWTSNGDGIFNSIDSLVPIYYPGTIDIQSGSVILNLDVIRDEEVYHDSFILSFVDIPSVYAGNDTLVVSDSAVYLKSATAINYDTLQWHTSGDGIFNNSNIVNPIYYPGYIDIQSGKVTLDLEATSLCGSSVDSVLISIGPFYTIEGSIRSSQKLEKSAVVIAFIESEQNYRSVQIESVQENGLFKFENILKGNYHLYAVPDTNNITGFIPSYYANNTKWQSAYLLPVYTDVYDVDISIGTLDFILPHGEASISGHMEMPLTSNFYSSIYCSTWFDIDNARYCMSGLSNVTIFLLNDSKSKILDYTLTDYNGDFYFNNLPFGKYIIDVEKTGYYSIPSSIITLSPEHKDQSDVIVEVNQSKIGVSFKNNIVEIPMAEVYPNPASHKINIQPVFSCQSNAKIEVYNIMGDIVLVTEIASNQTSSAYIVDISSLSSGLFFGQIICSSGISNFKFIVQ